MCQVVRVATSDEEVRDLNVSFWAAKVPLLLVEGFRGCPVVHPTPELVSVVFVEQLVPLVRVSFPIVLVGVPDLPIVTERGQLVVVLGVQQIHKVFVHASHDRVANLESGNIWSSFKVQVCILHKKHGFIHVQEEKSDHQKRFQCVQ